jgi:hypothetical protein
MGVIGDMGRYQQFQMGKAMTIAAENPSGGAAEGMGLGMGFAMANRMAQGVPMAGAGHDVPPPPPVETWHVAVNGQSQGPFDTPQILAAIREGQISRQTLVWSPSLGNWTPAGQVVRFSNGFAPVTPPPPPPPAS